MILMYSLTFSELLLTYVVDQENEEILVVEHITEFNTGLEDVKKYQSDCKLEDVENIMPDNKELSQDNTFGDIIHVEDVNTRGLDAKHLC